jgi:hypothetical protein
VSPTLCIHDDWTGHGDFFVALDSISMILTKIKEVNKSTHRLDQVSILFDSMGIGSRDRAILAPAFGTT